MSLDEEYQDRNCDTFFSDLYFIFNQYDHKVCTLLDYFPNLVGLTILYMFVGQQQEYYNRQQFDLQTWLEKAQIRSKEILHNILPPFVVDKILHEDLE